MEIVWMHSVKRIVAERQAQYVHPYTGAILDVEDDDNLPEFPDDDGNLYPAVFLDLTTAHILDQLWRNLSPENQAEYATYGFAGAVELGWMILGEKRQAQGEIPTLFTLGNLMATPGASRVLEAAGQHPIEFITRHASGDWGDLDDEDKQENEFSVQNGFRIFSAYHTSAGEKIWVITEADRSVTTILLPEEY